jgi:hypothetical protein
VSFFRLSAQRKDRIGRATVLAVLFAVPGLASMYLSYVADPDIWWHLRAGEWILQHRAFPHTDPFSIYGMNRPWAAYSWLFELAVLKLYRLWELPGIVAYTAGMTVAIVVALYALIQRLQADFTKSVLLTLAATLALSTLLTPRPWLFTILLFVLEMDILLTARRTGNARVLLWLPVLFVFWANVHIQFIDGLLVLGVAAVEPLAERWWPYRQTQLRSGALWAALGACVLATFVNPYGWYIYRSAFELAKLGGTLEYFSEMRALAFRTLPDSLVLFLALTAAGALAWSRRFPFFQTALLFIGSVVSFRSMRDVWFVVTVGCAILAANLPGNRAEAPPESESGRPRLPVLAWASVFAATGLLLWAGTALFQVNSAQLRERLATEMPVRAVEAIREKGYAGPLFNDYDWGGFLIWNLRQPVSIDGRAALHGEKQIERSYATWNGKRDWAADPNLAAAGLTIGPVDKPLTQLLRLDPRFTLVYEDKLAAVFVRRDSKNQSAAGTPLGGASR